MCIGEALRSGHHTHVYIVRTYILSSLRKREVKEGLMNSRILTCTATSTTTTTTTTAAIFSRHIIRQVYRQSYKSDSNIPGYGRVYTDKYRSWSPYTDRAMEGQELRIHNTPSTPLPTSSLPVYTYIQAYTCAYIFTWVCVYSKLYMREYTSMLITVRDKGYIHTKGSSTAKSMP